jgi:hypothetical protein
MKTQAEVSNAAPELTETAALAEIGRISRENPFTEREFDALEEKLKLIAAVRGWTGDPLRQPASSVLGAIRAIRE